MELNDQSTHSSQEVFVFPASFAQQRLWFLNSLVPGNPFYNISAAIRLSGHLNTTALEQTFNEIVRRHEVLRTSFVMKSGQLHQVVVEGVIISCSLVDLRYLPIHERESAAKQLAIAQSRIPFDLTADLLFRVKIFQLDVSEHILLLNLHHIIADGWSIGVLVRELGTLYTAFSAGKPSPLPNLPIQYADFTHWQREWLQGELLESQLSYWQQHLAGLAVLNLPTDRPRRARQSYRGATQNLELSKSLTASLEALSQQTGVTLFMLLLAAFQTLLYRYSGQEDIAVGSPIANRNRAEIEPLIGFFVNSLVLRTDLSGNPTFRELLARVREVTLGAYTHQDLPFERLVQELQPERELSRHPLFQVAISLQNTPITTLELPGLVLSQLELHNGTSRLDLEFHWWQTAEGLRGQVIYSVDLFDCSTITRMLGHFQTLLAGIVANPQQRLIDLPILTTAERQQLLCEWNNTQQAYPFNRCIHQLFEEQVNNTPEAIAVVYADEQLTYQELNRRSNQLAHYLQKLGVGSELLVGICLERSLLMIVGVLAILKAGGAYLPLDPTLPLERLKLMWQDAQISVLLTQQSLAPLLAEAWGEQLLYLDGDHNIAQQSEENPNSDVTAANLAYVIYTSGSTGKPKGVLVQHRGLCNLAEAQIQTFALKPEHRVLQFASLSFDASIFEIVMALRVGATLYLLPEAARLGAALTSYLQKHAITHATLPPAVIKISPLELPALQTLIAAGEACSPQIVARWAGVKRFFNAYGLTETTVWSTIAEITDSSGTSIGRAIANTQVYVLNASLQLQPVGIPGELYIGGVGLARGYLNRPDLTFERFIPNPFLASDITSSLLYKTGDLVRYLPDGNLEFLGRLDHQVKIRGYRIELAEIESLLCQHPAVRAAVVVAGEDSGNNQLVAYLVFNPELTLSTADLRCFLKQKLPSYMIPSAFVVQTSLPLHNGKIDRSGLTALNIAQLERSFVAPRTATEATLTTLWAKVLRLGQVGIEDNFFELGGDSLLAINLLEQVNQQFEQNLPVSDLFIAPTVEQFAPLVEKHKDPADPLPWSPLVPLQFQGSQLPFFCVHPVFGVVLPYYELACQIGTEQPFYGLQPFGLDGLQPPLTSIEEMATRYIKAIRQVQPQGPYRLGGWSFGGLVAFEMAQQLLQVGEQVSFLAILDTPSPVSSKLVSYWDISKFLFTTVTRSIYPFLLDYWSLIGDRFQSAVNFSTSAPNKISHPHTCSSLGTTISHLIPPEIRLRMLDELTIHRLMQIFFANSRAAFEYLPQPYPGAITLFRTSESLIKSDDSTLGWNKLAMSDVSVHAVPGNHLTMLRKPHVQLLAKLLREYLSMASRESYFQ